MTLISIIMDNNPQVVNQVLDQNPAADPQTQVKVNPEDVNKPVPGDKTESALLLKSLQEEREKRRLLEEENQSLKTSALSENESDEGRQLKQLLGTQAQRIERLEQERELEKVYGQFPKIKEMTQEFEAYMADYPRNKLENVAKLFLTEKGFMEAPRKGLEQPTGGSRVPLKQGLSSEDIKHLRENNFKKYQEMLIKGELG